MDHVCDLGKSGEKTALGSDGSLPTDRIARYCKIDEAWAESTVFGAQSAEEVLEQLLVHDGHA